MNINSLFPIPSNKMNRIIKYPVLYILIIVLCFILLIPSCESLKKDTDFIGTWQFAEKITTDDLVYNTTRTINLTKNTYEESYVIQRDNSPAISAIIGTKGDLSVSKSYLTFLLKELGTCAMDASEKCTSSIQWFGQGTQYWTDNIIYFKKTITGVFEVIGTTLRLTRDLNLDGDYEDTGEDVTFEMI